MQDGSTDSEQLFVPAWTPNEAAARMFALTSRTDPGTRGPKRALEALADSLGLSVDLADTNAVLGGQIASALDIDWLERRDFAGAQILLTGLNSLLEAATRSLWRLSRQSSIGSGSYTEVLRAFPTFQPALGKQEAVNRLSDLAGVGRDTLGPGGKEHRTTFESLAHRIAPELLAPGKTPPSKHAMVRALCECLDVPWITTAASTGQSVTLEGLNLLLAGAERRLGITSAGWSTAEKEGEALVEVLRAGLPNHWDGREVVTAMRRDESRNWRQMEWPGFFFEEQVSALLNVAYPTPPVGGPRRMYGATIFDYASALRVWDAKAHTVAEIGTPSGRLTSKHSSAAILNDASAITNCLSEQGLGFLILDGAATYDETAMFDQWHRTLTRQGHVSLDYVSNTGKSRRRKTEFTPLTLRALWISDLNALNAGVAGGWLRRASQGAQQVRPGQARGAPRNDKFQLLVHKASPWVVAEETWSESSAV